MAWWDSCFVMRGIHAEMWCGVDWKSNSSRYRTNRSTLNSRLDQNVQHRGATDANLARHVSGRASRLVQLHHALADTLGRATFRDDGPASESSGRRTKLNGGVGGVLRQGHHKRLTRNITQVNVGAALREFLLEGFWVVGELGGGGAGGDVGAAAGSGCGDRTDGAGAGGRLIEMGVIADGCLIGVSAAADVGAVVALAAMSVPASTLAAVISPAVVIALVAAAIPAGGFAASVLS